MNEAQIAEGLKANLPAPSVHTPAPVAAVNTDEGSSVVPSENLVDEMTLYKLAQHFDRSYNPADREANQSMKFIYETLSAQLGSTDYGLVIAKVSELTRMLGLNYSETKLLKLERWLKLDRIRASVEGEMGSIRNG